MKPTSRNANHSGSGLDIELYDLIESLTDQLQKGQPVDIDALTTAYPQYAQRLAQIVPTLQLMSDLTSFSTGAPLSGTLGDFRIVREIGRGGMGVVYEAEQISLSRRVALKILPYAAFLDERHLERFRNEARAAAALHHPRIVPIFAVGFERGMHFYTMQYIEGQTLADVCSKLAIAANDRTEKAALDDLLTQFGPEKKVRWNKVAAIGMQVADALEYAHAVGVVHRDVKPANLLIDKLGDAWLADFGLAQLKTDAALTTSGNVIGTLRYMSPEHASGKRGSVGHRSDIYGLGITLYELLTLRPAFDDPDHGQLLRKVIESQPPTPRSVDPSIPRDLETIVLKAIAKDPTDRYATAQDVSDDLLRFLQHRPPLAQRPTVAARFIKWSGRHVRSLIVMSAMLSVLSIGALVAVTLVWREQGRTESAHLKTLDALRDAYDQRAEANAQRQSSQRLSVTLALDRGLELCERGQLAHGLLWLARALELVADDQPELQSVIRCNLNDWSQQLVPMTGIMRLVEGPSSRAIVIDPRHRQVAAADDHSVRVWDLNSQSLIGIPTVFPSAPKALAFSHDGRTLFVGTLDGYVRQYDPRSGLPCGGFQKHSTHVQGIACGPDGDLVLSVSMDKPICLWEAATGKQIQPTNRTELPKRMVSFGGVFSESGNRCVTWTGDYLCLWDLKPDFTFRNNLLGLGAQTLCAAVRSDGNQLLAGRAHNAILCNLPDGDIVGQPFEYLDHVSAVAFHPQDRFYLIGSRDCTSRLWQVGSHQAVGQPLEHEGLILDGAFTEDGESFDTVCNAGTLRQWKTPGKPSTVSGPRLDDSYRLFLTPDASRLVSVVSRTSMPKEVIHVWNVATGKLLQELDAEHAVQEAALSEDGRTFVTIGDQAVRLWNLDSSLSLRAERRFPKQLNCSVAISPNGTRVAVGLRGAIQLLDGQQLSIDNKSLAISSEVNVLQFGPDNLQLFAHGMGKSQIFDCATGQVISELTDLQVAVRAATFSPDGSSLIIADRLGRVYRYDTKTGQLIEELMRGIREPREIAFHPNGRTVLSVQYGGQAQVFDLVMGRPLGVPHQHFGGIKSVSIARDGSHATTLVPTESSVETARELHLWRLPEELAGDPSHIKLWVEVNSGKELDTAGVAMLLSPTTWHQKQAELQVLNASLGALRFMHQVPPR